MGRRPIGHIRTREARTTLCRIGRWPCGLRFVPDAVGTWGSGKSGCFGRVVHPARASLRPLPGAVYGPVGY